MLPASSGGLKTTLMADNLLQALTELRTARGLTGTVYYSKGIQVKISRGKRRMGQGPGGFQVQSSRLFSPGGVLCTAPASPSNAE